MKRRDYFLLCGCMIMFCLTACSSDDNDTTTGAGEEPTNVEPTIVTPKTRADIVLTDAGSKVNDAANQFSLNFFNTVYQHQGAGSNLLISPFSTEAALAMTANGAEGTTLDEMLETLNMKEFGLDDINQYNQTIVKALTDLDNTSFVESANGIWVKKPITLLNSYASRVTTAYGANVENIDFSTGDIAAINDWTKAQTRGMIPTLFDEGETPNCDMLLANALYFNAVWASPFERELTRKGTFTNADGSLSTVDMMESVYEDRGYLSLGLSELCALPYGNRAYSMVFLLPHTDATLEEAIAELAGQDWKQVNTKLESRSAFAKLTLPRFELPATKYDLIPTLKDMGMQTPFTGSANFHAMVSDADVCIGKVNQKTALSVNEQGTQATAVTEVQMLLTGGDFTPTLTEFNLNRPFAFLIKEKSTGVILFAGTVNKL